jgi:hypothetical protein
MRNLWVIGALWLATAPAAAGTVRLEADRDATLIESEVGDRANGAGPALFAGRTSGSEDAIRRALIRFDVAAVLPEQAIVESVVLTLFMTPSNAEPRTLTLQRVQADWGEGPASSSGGGGAEAGPGDVTWLYTFYDAQTWVQPGGQFLGRVSAETEVAASGAYTWSGTEQLRADVTLWAADPGRNFGWVLRGDESASQSAKSFASREHPDPALRPILEITYHLPGDPLER